MPPCAKRFTFVVPDTFVDMPPVTKELPKTLGVSQLVRHARIASLKWRIQHPPFWNQVFARLWEVREELRLPHVARLLPCLAQLPFVDQDFHRHCEAFINDVPDDHLLDLRSADLLGAFEALGTMEMPAAMSRVGSMLVRKA